MNEGMRHEWRIVVEFFDNKFSELEYHAGEKCTMALYIPSVPEEYNNPLTVPVDEDEDVVAQMPGLPEPADLAQWIRPNSTTAIQEALIQADPGLCDLCEQRLTSSCFYALHMYNPSSHMHGPASPAVCGAATCFNMTCWRDGK